MIKRVKWSLANVKEGDRVMVRDYITNETVVEGVTSITGGRIGTNIWDYYKNGKSVYKYSRRNIIGPA